MSELYNVSVQRAWDRIKKHTHQECTALHRIALQDAIEALQMDLCNNGINSCALADVSDLHRLCGVWLVERGIND